MGTLTATAIVEEFLDQWRESDLHDRMPAPRLRDGAAGLVWLNQIAVYYQHQRKGYADRALRMLTALCDENDVTIKLIVAPLDSIPGCSPTLSAEQLVNWYQGHGFEDSEDTDLEPTMTRKPRR
jgi:hypothetical protein